MGRTRTTLARAPWSSEPLRLDQLRPGDLVFVGAEDTGLGAMVTELDGCAFSHVGVVSDTETGRMLSARTDRDARLDRPDLGGVRRNDLADLVGRGLFVAPLALPDDIRRAGIEAIGEGEEDPLGADDRSYSRFSFAKLVIASTALAAVRRRAPLPPNRAEKLWAAAVAAADALPWGGDFPGSTCAELVAAAYDLEFDAAAFWVADGEPHPTGVVTSDPITVVAVDDGTDGAARGEGEAATLDLTDHSHVASREGALDELEEVVHDLIQAYRDIDLTFTQIRAVVELMVVVWRYDRPLGKRLVGAAWELLGHPEPHHPSPVPDGPFAPPEFLLRFGRPLPTALVTPRMLLSSTVITSVHPLELG